MARNVRTYDHFCLLARALEQLGDRWTLLVVRDLLSGPKRFTDLMDRLGGITPKTLTLRLRELEARGVVTTVRSEGRKEVRYGLTAAGEELRPVITALTRWGWRHAWQPPQDGQRLHPEHLLLSLVALLNDASTEPSPACWHLRFDERAEYSIVADGQRWSLIAGPPASEPDVRVEASRSAWQAFMLEPSDSRARSLGVRVSGDRAAQRRFRAELRCFPSALPT